MDNPTSIKGLMQQMLPKGNDIVIGRVISVNPVRVQVINDEKAYTDPNCPSKTFRFAYGENMYIYWYLITAKKVLCVGQGGDVNGGRY